MGFFCSKPIYVQHHCPIYIQPDYQPLLHKSNVTSNTIENIDNECPICLKSEKTILLSCRKHYHYAHIECIMESKKIQCPICFCDVYYDCVHHIKNCKNTKCICKNASKIYETELILAHKLISDYMTFTSHNTTSNADVLDNIKKMLESNNIKNTNEIIKMYSH